ncbi:ornithine cyclodeaminase family protein [archaeon]|jgi:N-[(2S)-2-amino-2-carboxyethyl]-L-glutamate dehydrogenase|nr:ornithine cyclodeaminase family protein [archaeon]
MEQNNIKYLCQEDLIKCGLLDYSAAVTDVKLALISHTNQETLSDKIAIDLSYGHKFNALIATNGEYSSCKWLGANVENHKDNLQRSFPMLFLNEKQTGKPVAIMEGSLISALRTGAYVALGIEHLAKKDNNVLFIGTGVIAKAAAATIFSYEASRNKINNFNFYSRDQDHANNFKDILTDKLNITGEINQVSDLEKAISEADVTVSLSNTTETLFNLSNIKPNSTHIHLGGQDDDLEYIEYCGKNGKIICDDWAYVKKRDIQDVAFAHNQKMILDRDIYGNLGEVITGLKKGREGDEPIFFNAVGLPELDLYMGTRLFENALKIKDVGIDIPVYKKSNWILG